MKSMCRHLANVAKQIQATAIRRNSTAAAMAKRIYYFNYFEQPENTETFQKVWIDGSNYLKNFETFCGTFLHHSTDPNTMYPWVNFAVTKSMEIPFLGMKDEFWANYMKEAMAYKLKANPAAYQEMASFYGKELTAEGKERPESARFFITGIKAKESVPDEDLEENWKGWSGADFLHQQLNDDSRVVDSLFYKRFAMSPTFRYTVRTELKELDDASGHMIAQSVNNRGGIPEGLETFTGFYRVAVPVVASE